ncbi:3-oxoacyl-ACP synthase [Vibrio owensii 47666-1]|uniref:3-oxoacyl-ACP synthase III family protein n=1 Tax=Vibrio owensii TaxID=696485 RepID=UPI000592268A|nr:ketoacyl-ACP synthase III [Vibrio owensii]KIF46919.1 3-oxoacyl-ACP synthase [Vibrio owensii 47666-1]
MAYIQAIEVYTPDYCLDNYKLASDFPEWGVEKIFTKTGIESRYIAGYDETCLDMAESACERLFSNCNVDKHSIDFILLCTQSPDYFLPTTACLLQDRLGLKKSIGALDYNLGCSGYVYGLSLAQGLIASKQVKNVLLVTTEQYSKYINDNDKSVRTLFGDAATATLISNDDCENIGPFVFGTDGSGGDSLIVPHGANKHPISNESYLEVEDSSKNVRSPKDLYMNGSEVFTFTLKTVPKTVREILDKSGLTKSDIAHVVFHQANKFMLDILQKNCGFSDEQFLRSYQKYGNTVSNTLPIGLYEAALSGKLNAGDKVLLVGFGVGLSWGATILTWKGGK